MKTILAGVALALGATPSLAQGALSDRCSFTLQAWVGERNGLAASGQER